MSGDTVEGVGNSLIMDAEHLFRELRRCAIYVCRVEVRENNKDGGKTV